MTNKRCADCKEIYPLEDFVKDSWKKDGRGSYCYACRTRRAKATRESNRVINLGGLRIFEKYCPKCKETKPVEGFFKNAGRGDGLGDWCKECAVIANTCYVFNITEEQYFEMFERQQHRCAWCGRHKDELTKVLCVDHDRKCCPGRKSCGKCVRRLLCDGCNTSEGHLKHNPQIIAAIEAVAWFPLVV
jgi:hypothetical protein